MPDINTKFSVIARGYPAPTFQWYLGDQVDPETRTILTNNGDYDHVTTRVLDIYNAGSSSFNQTKYSCKVTNSVGSVWSTVATLTVNFAPYFTVHPITQAIYNDVTMTLIVAASGQPAPTYLWYKDAVLINNGGRISGATTNTLVITSYTGSDAGSYTCKASNFKGFATSNAAIITSATCIECGTGNSYFWDPTTAELNSIWDNNTYTPNISALVFGTNRYETLTTYASQEVDLGGTLTAIPNRVIAYLGCDLGSVTWGAYTARVANSRIELAGVFIISFQTTITFGVDPNYVVTREVLIFGGAGVTLLTTITLDALNAHVFSAEKTGANETTFYMGTDIIYVDASANTWTTGIAARLVRNENAGVDMVPWVQNIIAEKTGAGLPSSCCPGPEQSSYWTSSAGFTFP